MPANITYANGVQPFLDSLPRYDSTLSAIGDVGGQATLGQAQYNISTPIKLYSGQSLDGLFGNWERVRINYSGSGPAILLCANSSGLNFGARIANLTIESADGGIGIDTTSGSPVVDLESLTLENLVLSCSGLPIQLRMPTSNNIYNIELNNINIRGCGSFGRAIDIQAYVGAARRINVNNISVSGALTGVVSSSGTTVTAVSGITFTAAMVGCALTAGTMSVLITAFTSSTSVTVSAAPSWSSTSVTLGGPLCTFDGEMSVCDSWFETNSTTFPLVKLGNGTIRWMHNHIELGALVHTATIIDQARVACDEILFGSYEDQVRLTRGSELTPINKPTSPATYYVRDATSHMYYPQGTEYT